MKPPDPSLTSMPDRANNSLHVVHYLDAVREEAGGVVRCVVDLCGILARSGCRVSLATFDTHDIPPAWRNDDASTPKVIDLRVDPAAYRTAVGGASVVHLHTPWDRRNVAFAREARRAGIPYLVTLHGMLDDWCMAQKGVKKRAYLGLVGRRMLQRAYRVHCTAEGEASQAERWYPGGKSVVLPLVVDLPDPQALPGPQQALNAIAALNTKEPRVLFLSRLHPKKGLDLLIRAAALVVKEGTVLQLFVAGPGDDKYVAQLKNFASELGVADRVHFVGLVQGQRKLSLYQACDLFVLPTYQENFGLVLPEALACGTPVITTRGVDIWPEIEAAGGILVDNRPESLAEPIARLLCDLPALQERGARGREYVYNWLDPQRVVAEYLGLYREAAGTVRD